MDALTALKREAERSRWEMITAEALKARRRGRRKGAIICLVGTLAAWAIMITAIIHFGPAILRTAQAIWRG